KPRASFFCRFRVFLCRLSPPRAGARLFQIDPAQEQRQLLGQYPQGPRFLRLWPGKATLGQALGAHPGSCAVKIKQLDSVFPAIGEDIKMPAQGILLELPGHDIDQPLETLAQIGCSTGQVNPCCRTQRDHERSSNCTSAATSWARKPERISRDTPPGHCNR